MTDPSVKLNEVQAEKICKLTEDLYPYHPIVYSLKERLLTSNGNCEPSKLENLLNGNAYICARTRSEKLILILLYAFFSRNIY